MTALGSEVMASEQLKVSRRAEEKSTDGGESLPWLKGGPPKEIIQRQGWKIVSEELP